VLHAHSEQISESCDDSVVSNEFEHETARAGDNQELVHAVRFAAALTLRECIVGYGISKRKGSLTFGMWFFTMSFVLLD